PCRSTGTRRRRARSGPCSSGPRPACWRRWRRRGWRGLRVYNERVSALDLRLAPMAGVSNAPFRLVARECGAGRLTSEEIDARALVHDNARTLALAAYLPEERPLAMQLLGEDPDLLAEAARRLEAAGADGIDLNMGCPVAKIVAKGQGAALMRDPLRAGVIFRTLIEAHLAERPALVQLKKHLAWYSDGLPFAARARPAIFAARTPTEVYEVFWRLW